eukprot:13783600-Alexandrium_andersonii.AAC.1
MATKRGWSKAKAVQHWEELKQSVPDDDKDEFGPAWSRLRILVPCGDVSSVIFDSERVALLHVSFQRRSARVASCSQRWPAMAVDSIHRSRVWLSSHVRTSHLLSC